MTGGGARTRVVPLAGPAGVLCVALDEPAGLAGEAPAAGTLIVCHPHPQHGGTMENKVVQTLMRAGLSLGWRVVRFNYRGVESPLGRSEGGWGDGRGELDDTLAVIAAHRPATGPWTLAGFSFGAWMAVEALGRLPADQAPQRLALVGPSTARQTVPPVPEALRPATLVVHGEEDEVVPLAATLGWARPQQLPVTVMPGVGHFFHGQLVGLKQVLIQAWRP